MIPRQTRIFAPYRLPYRERWVETLAGKIIGPLTTQFPEVLFWFSRYGDYRAGSSEDTDLTNMPNGFEQNGIFRSVRFRYWLTSEGERDAFETQLSQLIAKADCWIYDCRLYPDLVDLAKKRFCGGDFSDGRREQRRQLVAVFNNATCKLFMHMLAGPDSIGEFRLEENEDKQQNPNGSTFESIHHIFCNITEPPLEVLVVDPVMGTRMYHEDKVTLRPVRVRF